MATIINIPEASQQLSHLLEAVERGEQVIIARAGQPVATLVAYAAATNKIAPPGGMAGSITLADDFDAPIDEIFDSLQDESPAA